MGKMKPEAVDAIEAMELEPQETIAEMKTDDHDLEMLLDSEPETFNEQPSKQIKTEESSPSNELSSQFGKKLKTQKSPANEGVKQDKKAETKPAFVDLKLKKASRVQREWEEPELESVELV